MVYEQTAFPSPMGFGVWYEATVTMRNGGSGTWTKADGYHLVSRNDPADLWTTTEVALDDADAIGPGQEKTFHFSMRAPFAAGTYYPAWSMAVGDAPFGEITNRPSLVAEVGVEPCISEQNVVYSLGSPGVLYRYDLETGITTQLTSADTDDHLPEISGDVVAYTSLFPDGHYAISVLDLATGAIRRFDVAGTPGPPDTDGAYVVWASTIVSETESHTHLFLLDLTSEQITELDQDVGDPRIDGGRIAYLQTSTNVLRIYDAGQGQITAEFSSLPLTCYTGLDIQGDQVALLRAFHPIYPPGDIWWGHEVIFADVVAGTVQEVSVCPAVMCHPRMSDAYLVWHAVAGRWCWTPYSGMVAYDLATGDLQSVPVPTPVGANLSVSSRKVAWDDGNAVYVLDLRYQSVWVIGPNAVVVPERTSFPSLMDHDQWYEATATMRNTGLDTWTKADGYHLVSCDGDLWTTTEVPLDDLDMIGPGGEKTFVFPLRAPHTPGLYHPAWSMALGEATFGEATSQPAMVGPDAVVIPEETSLPSGMDYDQWYEAAVTMRNTGLDTWTKAAGYRLVCRNDPTDLWTTAEVALDDGDAIAPGQEKTFGFQIRAPHTAGAYMHQWSMAVGDLPFGEATNQPVSVIGPSAVVVSENTAFPTPMAPEQWDEATVTMRNTGPVTWTKADGYGLICLNSPPDLWTTTWVPLEDGDAIAPGEEKTFRFPMRAPSGTGTYLPSWSMAVGGSTPFGEITNQLVSLGASNWYAGLCVSKEEVIYAPDRALVRYELGTGITTQLTSGEDTSDSRPEISGRTIAYRSQFPDGHWAVSVLDLTTGAIQQFDAGGSPGPPDIDGSYVVWASTVAVSDTESHTHLFLLNLTTGQVMELDQDTGDPRIDAGRIAYVQTTTNLLRIYDIAQARVTMEFACPGGEVDISGNQVAAISDLGVVLFDLAAGTQTQLASWDASGSSSHPNGVGVSQGHIVWTQPNQANCRPWTIAFYNTATGARDTLPTGPINGNCYPNHCLPCLGTTISPAIESSRVVWQLCCFESRVFMLDHHSISVTSNAAAYFPDVPCDYWAYSEIMACHKASIVQGYPDGLYHPGWAVTRAQMAVYISRALAGGGAIPDPTPPATFLDVPTGYWAWKWVEYCYDLRVVQGYWDGYHPVGAVNRAQIAVYLARSMVAPWGDWAIPWPPGPPTFPDVPASYWAYKWIEYCYAQGVVQGYSDGYHPEETVNRAQMAVYVQRAFRLPM